MTSIANYFKVLTNVITKSELENSYELIGLEFHEAYFLKLVVVV